MKNQCQYIPTEGLFWVLHLGGWSFFLLLFLNSMEGGQAYSRSLLFSESLRFILTLVVLLGFRYYYLAGGWHGFGPGETVSMVLGYNLLFAIIIAFLVPFSISVSDPIFEVFQRESIRTTRFFDEKFVSFLYSYSIQVIWCFLYVLFKAYKTNRFLEAQEKNTSRELKQERIHSLAGELSPHFLYNGLNNLCSLMDEDIERSQGLLRAFSDLLRYCLEMSKRDKVSFADEIQFVENYISVCRIQFEERLHFEMIMHKDIKSYAIPPMILQLMVENAIKYSVASSNQGGYVSIVSRVDGELIEIKVVNTVAGICKEVSLGLGINNISQRLDLLYGDLASIEYRKRNSTFEAKLRIPKEKYYEAVIVEEPQVGASTQ